MVLNASEPAASLEFFKLAGKVIPCDRGVSMVPTLQLLEAFTAAIAEWGDSPPAPVMRYILFSQDPVFYIPGLPQPVTIQAVDADMNAVPDFAGPLSFVFAGTTGSVDELGWSSGLEDINVTVDDAGSFALEVFSPDYVDPVGVASLVG